MSDDPKVPAIVTAAVTPAPLPDGFTVPGAVALARDVAIEMLELPAILRKHAVTAEQYATLKEVPYFKNIVEEFARQWNAPSSVTQRLAQQTAAGLEEVLPDVIARMKIKNEPLQGIAQLAKVLADIAGVGGSARQAPQANEKFKIVINLGADTQTFEKSKPIINIMPDPDPPADVAEIQSFSQGFGSLLAIQTEPEKA